MEIKSKIFLKENILVFSRSWELLSLGLTLWHNLSFFCYLSILIKPQLPSLFCQHWGWLLWLLEEEEGGEGECLLASPARLVAKHLSKNCQFCLRQVWRSRSQAGPAAPTELSSELRAAQRGWISHWLGLPGCTLCTATTLTLNWELGKDWDFWGWVTSVIFSR